MAMTSTGLLIFDLDGTLVNSAPDLAVAVNKTLVALGRPCFDEKKIESWVGNGARTLIERALSGTGVIALDLDVVQVDTALSLFHQHYSQGLSIKTHLYDGVADTLEKLQAVGYTMAIVTNKPERYIHPILKSLSIDGLFAMCIGGDTLQKHKPDPLPLLHVCRQLGFDIEDSIMIGDSKNDILAAKAANMRCVGLTYGYNYGENIALANPDWVFDEFSHLIQLC